MGQTRQGFRPNARTKLRSALEPLAALFLVALLAVLNLEVRKTFASVWASNRAQQG